MFKDIKKIITRKKLIKEVKNLMDEVSSSILMDRVKVKELCKKAVIIEDKVMGFNYDTKDLTFSNYCHMIVELRCSLIELVDELDELYPRKHKNSKIKTNGNKIKNKVDRVKKTVSTYKHYVSRKKKKSFRLNFKFKKVKRLPKITTKSRTTTIIKNYIRHKKHNIKLKINKVSNNVKNFFSKLKPNNLKRKIKPVVAAVSISLGLGLLGILKASSGSNDVTINSNHTNVTSNTIENNINNDYNDITVQKNDKLCSLISQNHNNLDNLFSVNNTTESNQKENVNIDKNINVKKENNTENKIEHIGQNITIIQIEQIEEKSAIQIDSKISVLPNSSIFTNEYDAYFNENRYIPMYDSTIERKVEKIVLSNGNELVSVNDNEQLDSFLKLGYEIVGCAVTNEYAINDAIEGFYRIDSLQMENSKVLTKNYN